MTASITLDGAMIGAAFVVYVERILVPTPSLGNIVILDTLPARKPVGIRHAIAQAGAERRVLPSFSSAFKPMESACSKIKVLLKKAAARTLASLWAAIRRAIDAVLPKDCRSSLAVTDSESERSEFRSGKVFDPRFR